MEERYHIEHWKIKFGDKVSTFDIKRDTWTGEGETIRKSWEE